MEANEGIPLHAFNTEEEWDDEEMFYYTVCDSIEDDVVEENKSTLSENSTTTDESEEDTRLDDGETLNQSNSLNNKHNTFNRTQELDDIIRSTSMFLENHPRPPGGYTFTRVVRRSTREKRRPIRYYDHTSRKPESEEREEKRE